MLLSLMTLKDITVVDPNMFESPMLELEPITALFMEFELPSRLEEPIWQDLRELWCCITLLDRNETLDREFPLPRKLPWSIATFPMI